jgi:predicted ribosome quality control (RQC) complex YloA/Tae2 family protein
MPLDAATLSGVVAELRPAIEGAKIDKIFQPGKDELIFQLRTGSGNRKLLLTANPAHPRIQLTELNRENPATPPMFCMLLRKHLASARILTITQPSMERMVDLELEALDELGYRVSRHLILEAMGRRANLILTDESGRVIDCIRHVDMEMSESRPLLPGLLYRQPPAQPGKCDPLSLTREELEQRFYQAPMERKVVDWMLDTFLGLSPLVCRELVCQSMDGVDSRIGTLSPCQNGGFLDVFWHFLEGIRQGRLTPCGLFQGGKPKDFSCLFLYQYGLSMECRRYDSFSKLLDDFYATREQQERVRSKGQELLKSLTNARDRTARKLEHQRKERADAENREEYRIAGELITANLYRMQRGEGQLRCQNYYDPDCAEITISLDPLLTPQQNAAKYFKRYSKAKTAEAVLGEQIAKGERELDYLESVLEAVHRAEGERDLAEIRQELETTGYLRPKQTGKKAPKPMKCRPMEFRSSTGFRISVGRNNSQNDELTCKMAGFRDIWLHTQKIHGSHVIIWTEGRPVDAQTLTEGAQLAAYYSQAREGSNVPVDYTEVRYVKKPAGARPGMVIYTTYSTAYVTPEATLAERLKQK